MSRPSLRGQGGPFAPARGPYTSRALYPSFLSLQDTLHLHLRWFWNGLLDAFRWNVVIQVVATDPEIRSNLFKSFMLNILSLVSIYAFDLILHPLVRDQQKWFHRNIGWFYRILWLLPVVGASLYLNSSWCTLIAKRTYTIQHGTHHQHRSPATYSGLLTTLATSAYRAVMIGTSVVVSVTLGAVPIVGPMIGFTFMCWVDAYYCFEFIWIARGLSLARRVRYLEERWAYYFAFGLPSAALCTWGSSLANAAIFALIFPAYIIMAMHAHPAPIDPYNPAPSSSSTPQDGHNEPRPIHPSPFVPIRIPVFAVVIWLNEWVVWVLSGGGVRGGGGSGGRGPGVRAGRWRSFSDNEEGEIIELVEGGRSNSGVNSGETSRGGGLRPSRGAGLGRRKAD